VELLASKALELVQQRRYEEALELRLALVQPLTEIMPENHPRILLAMNNLSTIYAFLEGVFKGGSL